ncbi:MAG: threonine synthase [Clostridia bacterium]|nr:threonine synthase [Clostridia bacterium]MBQ8637347.1 threonine synthase [Clostridia bacterium]
MQYQSTRNKSISITSAEAIKKGLSEEGGLFVPESIPSVSLDEIAGMKGMNYRERAEFILSKYLTDFTAEELKYCVENAYTKEKFETDNIAPVYKLDDNTYFLELWHGPTCAFKDMALQILPYLLTTSMKKTNENDEVVILVATSGDTGKAALEGFKDVPGTRIVVFYPDNGVSEIQKLQMITQEGENVSVCAVKGNFDDAQNGVKRIFTDGGYKQMLAANHFKLSSANSINWGRLVPQIVYYFSAYADMLAADEITLGEKINVVVPTGNFGNILASYYAYQMGLPVNKFICASNKNNVLTDFIKTGKYDKNRKFHTTISPSMDILISSNLERFLYHLSGRNDSFVADLMQKLNGEGSYEIPADIKDKMTALFAAGCTDDDETMAAIKKCDDDFGYVMDTHTAVAKAVYDNYVAETGDKTKTIIASTASPFKFNQSVLIALGGSGAVAGKDEFTLLGELSQRSGMKIPDSLASLKTKPKLFESVCEKGEMIEVVNDFLQI